MLKTKKIHPNTRFVFSSIIFRKDKLNIEKWRNDVYILLKEEHLGLKNLHLLDW